MNRIKVLFGVALLALLFAADPAAAVPPTDDGISGGFQMTVHTHSNDPDTLLFPDVERLAFDFEEDDTFAYSSRQCDGTARFNDLGLDFSPDYPGVDDDDGTAAVRHQVAGSVTEDNGATGTIEGTITTVLCQGGEETDNVIVTSFVSRYRQVSGDQLQIIGRYEISPTESTGTFEGLEGEGQIRGVFTCLGEAVCATLGEYTDFVGARGDLTKGPGEIQPGLVGTFSDPTVETA